MQRSASQVHGLRVGTDVPHPRSHGPLGRVRSEEPTAWAAGTLALPTAHEAKAGRSVDRGKGARDWGCSTRNVDSTAKGQLARSKEQQLGVQATEGGDNREHIGRGDLAQGGRVRDAGDQGRAAGVRPGRVTMDQARSVQGCNRHPETTKRAKRLTMPFWPASGACKAWADASDADDGRATRADVAPGLGDQRRLTMTGSDDRQRNRIPGALGGEEGGWIVQSDCCNASHVEQQQSLGTMPNREDEETIIQAASRRFWWRLSRETSGARALDSTHHHVRQLAQLMGLGSSCMPPCFALLGSCCRCALVRLLSWGTWRTNRTRLGASRRPGQLRDSLEVGGGVPRPASHGRGGHAVVWPGSLRAGVAIGPGGKTALWHPGSCVDLWSDGRGQATRRRLKAKEDTRHWGTWRGPVRTGESKNPRETHLSCQFPSQTPTQHGSPTIWAAQRSRKGRRGEVVSSSAGGQAVEQTACRYRRERLSLSLVSFIQGNGDPTSGCRRRRDPPILDDFLFGGILAKRSCDWRQWTVSGPRGVPSFLLAGILRVRRTHNRVLTGSLGGRHVSQAFAATAAAGRADFLRRHPRGLVRTTSLRPIWRHSVSTAASARVGQP
ncbi:hypothetical protein PCL_00501 [Purpureocillium lilacinum]|uniref:Uncharacterized protein n=1 Tax=Purpureocillium lilacinum TaxID=33203 RepID=A0A2U3E531_PURLI|nr:hypothetical protein Purlil1_11002 [Purpureocillium lilacinum]PWI69589.1 hypothetical protein PCL_00501 [Purpureocillium lilacinum]